MNAGNESSDLGAAADAGAPRDPWLEVSLAEVLGGIATVSPLPPSPLLPPHHSGRPGAAGLPAWRAGHIQQLREDAEIPAAGPPAFVVLNNQS